MLRRQKRPLRRMHKNVGLKASTTQKKKFEIIDPFLNLYLSSNDYTNFDMSIDKEEMTNPKPITSETSRLSRGARDIFAELFSLACDLLTPLGLINSKANLASYQQPNNN